MKLPDHFFHNRRLDQLVENKTSFTVKNAELNIYETHHYAEQVVLQFSQPVLASMLEGKKVMHLREKESFNFLPGESLCLPADEVMCIDFPEAREDNPTRCLAMQIDETLIAKIITDMNERMPKADSNPWTVNKDNYAFTNDHAIYQLLQRLIFVFMEDNPSKDTFIQMMMKELIIRIKQSENRASYHNQLLQISDSNRMAYVIKFIREHLDQPLNIKMLADKACMSEPNFHKVFRHEIGMSPVKFINQSRIKRAASLLKNPQTTVGEVYMACGFNNLSYFNRVFKNVSGKSPKAYQNYWSSKSQIASLN
ncbi:MAG: AraC family transcriptional regulator [Bacteroidota bacterium]